MIPQSKPLLLYDRFGRPGALAPTVSPSRAPSVKGTWREAGVEGRRSDLLYGVDRQLERRKARIAFFTNPLVEGITGLLTSYVVGDEFSYGKLDDKAAQNALDDFWSFNDLDLLAERMWLEYVIDGESAALIDIEAGPGQPAKVALADVDQGLELTHNTVDGVTGLKLQLDGEQREYEPDEFIWTAHHALWNDPRGWPMMMRALPACLAYLGLIDSRLRAQEALGRINGIYHALYYPNDPNGRSDYQAKVDAYRNVPVDGSVLALAIDALTGNKEEFELTQGPSNASDAASDARLVRLLAAVTMTIPPHWLGDAEDTNRASTDNMNGPPLVTMKRRQSVFRSMMNRLFRLELLRLHGPNHTYRVAYSEPSKNDPLTLKRGYRKVKAQQLEVPWTMPTLDEDSLEQVVAKVQLLFKMGDASRQTRQELMGIDPATEQERLAAEPKPPRVVLNTVKPKTSEPDDKGDDKGDGEDDGEEV